MIKTVIIDDELASSEALRIKIAKISTDIEIIAVFNSAKTALNQINDLDPDLIFLDIEMPGMDGFMFLEARQERFFEVIINTAHNEYAVNALRHSAVDFLLKPIDIDELKEAIERLKAKLTEKNKPDFKSKINLNARFDKIPIPTLRGLQFVLLKEILYFESDGNYSNIYLENKQKIVSSRKIGEYETLLENLHFFRIHNTTMINLSQIKEYLKGEGGSVILTSGTELDVSKRKKKEFLDLIGF